ncbi:alkanesulfonate monooxygenase [Ochrobactrum sp. 19YEA23]|uniref:LLM class flavin-dependent oxidoreductase n=1 Tax=Ochrobactrum sp. 19YEA23 TaxID=3039854 RepID=UPI00247A9B6A|nr:alkanesulfonate monooxygenase [Ochrobactrum sp. 19YEA23]
MSVELIGYVPHTRATETSGLWWSSDFDVDYIEETALAHEEAGFDSVLVGMHSWSPDPWMIASHILRITRKLKVLVAHRPGTVQPTLAARQAITLDRLAGGGRLGLHIITGAPGGELQRDGDTLADDLRYERTAEYIDVLRKVWTADQPFDHAGPYYSVKQGFSSVRPLAQPAISFAGSSAGALAAGPGRTDYYMVWGEPLAASKATFDELHGLANERGRPLTISVSLRAIIGESEDKAWKKAEDIYNRAASELATVGTAEGNLKQMEQKADSVGAIKLDAIARQGDVQDERLWLGFTRLVGRGGSTATLVGTLDQVTDSYLQYYQLGASAFYLRGWEIAADARKYGRQLIPALRKKIAKYELRKNAVHQAAE